uniref:HAT C-terminal dimerisation domain-containing protein n=1 Tax=Latimeria chalumnae TaxID=7897 RepID=H3A9I3_LATCH
MSGRYNGLQAHLTRVNPLIRYVPCAAHSLNLVGVNSINNSCLNAINFLFSAVDTRWSSRVHSTKALCQNYDRIRQGLEDLSKDMNQSPDTQLEAASLHSKMEQLETAFWHTVVQRFKMTSMQLQKMDINLSTAVHLLRSLESFVTALRDQFENFEYAAKNTCKAVSQKYRSDLCHTRKRKQFADESMLYDWFRVLFELSSLDVTDIVIHKCAAELAAVYPQDLDQNFSDRPQNKKTFPDELIQFKHFVQDEPAKLLQVLRHSGLQSTFPNVDIALRIFLTLPVTNCEEEHTFSKMARMKNELRSTMHQRRLNALSLMAVESELVRQMVFNDLICDFSSLKARKKQTI